MVRLFHPKFQLIECHGLRCFKRNLSGRKTTSVIWYRTPGENPDTAKIVAAIL